MEYINLHGVSHMVSGRKIPELNFFEIELSADDGTNRGHASYEIDGDQLTIGPIAVTRMAHPDETLPESSLFEHLSAVTTFAHHGELMHLGFHEGELVYREREQSEPA